MTIDMQVRWSSSQRLRCDASLSVVMVRRPGLAPTEHGRGLGLGLNAGVSALHLIVSEWRFCLSRRIRLRHATIDPARAASLRSILCERTRNRRRLDIGQGFLRPIASGFAAIRSDCATVRGKR